MTDPRADTIRQFIEHCQGFDIDVNGNAALTALDGLLADAAEQRDYADRLDRLMREAVEAAAENGGRVAALETTLRYGRAVALVWGVAAMDEWGDTKMQGSITAHPLSCVVIALNGETEPSELGCSRDQLALALSVLDDEEPYTAYRAALAAPAETSAPGGAGTPAADLLPAETPGARTSGDTGAEAAPAPAQVGLDGPFEMETPAAEGQT